MISQALEAYLMEAPSGSDPEHALGLLADWCRKYPQGLDKYTSEVGNIIKDMRHFDYAWREYSMEAFRDEDDEKDYLKACEVFDVSLRKLEDIIGSVETNADFLKRLHEACNRLYGNHTLLSLY